MAKTAEEIIGKAAKKLQKLKDIDPFFIDLSLRENPVGARVGMTLEDKLAILPKLRDFGFKDILLGTLDYGMPEELEVDDDFMMYLRDHGEDMTGCFAFTQIGLVKGGAFTPDPSMIKLRDYKVPNTIHEIYVSDDGIGTQYGTDDPVQTLKDSLPASIEWLRENVHGDDKGKPRIIINLVDGCDGFHSFLKRTTDILQLLADQYPQIEGVSFEDDRGTYLPFQVGAYTEVARQILGPKMRLMVHMHAGAGFENASVIEALLHGADGVWAGLPKRAAIIGHASLGELMANLLRVGNPNLTNYKLEKLLSLATTLQVIDEQERVPDDLPILGNNAYRLPLTFFQQIAGRDQDLTPETIGGTYRYRICPVVSDTGVIAGRLAEVTGCRAEEFPKPVLDQMIRLMRRDLRAGKRIVYDEPENLLALYARATVNAQ